jgi:hypothetical protein
VLHMLPCVSNTLRCFAEGLQSRRMHRMVTQCYRSVTIVLQECYKSVAIVTMCFNTLRCFAEGRHNRRMHRMAMPMTK